MRAVNSRLGQMIRQRRIIEGYTQAEIAARCGISVSQLSRVERNLCFPSAEALIKMADILNINLSRLLTCAAYTALNEPKAKEQYLWDISEAFKRYLSSTRK